MTCRELADFLSDYLAGGLTPEIRAAFERHLTRCPACVNYLSAYRATVELNRQAFATPEAEAEAAADVPEDLVKAILAARRR
jgi:anti-sigma factor RsiW